MRYKRKRTADGHRNLHRVLMEEHLGRRLRDDEHVHHLNEDKLDNRLENLVVLSQREHQLLHHPPILPTSKPCVICGAIFVPHKTKRRRQQTCGASCKSILLVRRNRTRKLSDADVTEIREMRNRGVLLRVLAARYGVTEALISNVARGLSRTQMEREAG
jgi:predicted nucleic acid-binding Zn ribbon protein